MQPVEVLVSAVTLCVMCPLVAGLRKRLKMKEALLYFHRLNVDLFSHCCDVAKVRLSVVEAM